MDTLTLRVCVNILICSVLYICFSSLFTVVVVVVCWRLLPQLMMLFYNYWLALSFCCASSPLARRNKNRGNKKEILFCEMSTKYGKIKLTSPGSCALFSLFFLCSFAALAIYGNKNWSQIWHTIRGHKIILLLIASVVLHLVFCGHNRTRTLH